MLLIKLLSIPLVAVLFISGCGSHEPTFRGSVYDDPITVPNFTLSDQYGKSFQLDDHLGEISLLFFGYIYCPDVCPMTLSTWKRVQDNLRDDYESVNFVFITVGPERDSAEAMRKHLSIYSNDFYGLTGTPSELDSVYKSFGVFHEKEQISEFSTGYTVAHTGWIYVIDRDGKWRLSHLFDASAQDLLHDIKQLVKS